MGLYYIKVAFPKGYYKLEEIDKTKLKDTYTRNYLKKFIYKKDAFILVKDDFESDLDKLNSLNKSKSWENILIINKNSNKTTIKTRSLIRKSI
jgi:hypothetical protein